MRFRQTEFCQSTIGKTISLDGIGIHGGRPARMSLHPADADTGIVFHCTGAPGDDCFVPATLAHAVPADLATRLAAPRSPMHSVGTVEHVLAALFALGIDNALVEIDGPEVPILDGSARPIVEALDDAGVVVQRRPKKLLEVLAPVRVAAGPAFAEFRPRASGLSLDVGIAFANPMVGTQRHATLLSAETFRREIAMARTFGFLADAERLWRDSFALGASFDNTIVVAPDRILNPAGLRVPDEFVRHKLLDAVGDLALAGMPIRGAFRSFRGGHALNRAVLAALFADRTAWRIVEPDGAPSRRTPGEPRRPAL